MKQLLRRSGRLLCALSLGAFSLCPGGSISAAPPASLNIYVPSGQITFINELCNNLRIEAGNHSQSLEMHEAGNSGETQLQQLSMPLEGSHARIVRAVDGLNPRTIVDMAQKNNETVIFVSTLVARSVIDSYENAWFVGANSRSVGNRLAENVIGYITGHSGSDLNGNGIIDIMVIHGPAGHVEERARYASLVKYLDQHGIPYRFVNEVTADWYYDRAYEHVSALIKADKYQEADLIVAMNDDMGLAVIDAVEQSGRANLLPKLPIFSVDGIHEALLAIRRGKLKATVKHNLPHTAATIFAIANGEHNLINLSRVAGQKVESRVVFLSPQAVTANNVEDFLNDPALHRY